MAVLFGRVMLKVSFSAIFMLTVLNCNITKIVHFWLIHINSSYLDRLSGAHYCISRPANGCTSYTHISYHDILLDGESSHGSSSYADSL